MQHFLNCRFFLFIYLLDSLPEGAAYPGSRDRPPGFQRNVSRVGYGTASGICCPFKAQNRGACVTQGVALDWGMLGLTKKSLLRFEHFQFAVFLNAI
jgi:hypothetical protein